MHSTSPQVINHYDLWVIFFTAQKINAVCNQRTNLLALKNKVIYFVIKNVFKVFRWCSRFFYKKRFFSTQPKCYLTFSWTELQMLLRCCLIHISIILFFIFIIFVSMSRPRSIYVVYMWSVFHFPLHFHYD